MTLWLVRAGANGERESLQLEQGITTIGWDDLPDLSRTKDKEALQELLQKHYPDSSPNRLSNWRGQVWAFVDRMKKGDYVVLPLKSRPAIAIGEIAGEYQYRSDLPLNARHTRKVKWLVTDMPRARLDQDVLYSLGAFMTVCQVSRNRAEERILAAMKGKGPVPAAAQVDVPSEVEAATDLEQVGQDQIRDLISRKFRGHDMEGLVAAILRAQGHTVHANREGADGGADLLAGSGPLGLDSPKLCVQVKSGDGQVGQKELRELGTVLQDFGADYGLMVAWGGFKESIYKESRQRFFQVRCWDSDDLIRALLANYERLDEGIRAELPLKRIWAVVNED